MAGVGEPPLLGALVGIWEDLSLAGAFYPMIPRSRSETWPPAATMT